jgi:flagellar motor protein MotB
VKNAEAAIVALAAVLRNVGNRIDVFGHTDPEPVSGARFPSNRALSLARARTVMRMLHDAGYGRRIAAFGLGDTRFGDLARVEPRERRYQLARRVDIVVRPSRERY